MPIQPSWDSLADQLRSMNSRLEDLENARRSFATRIANSQSTLTFGGTAGVGLNSWTQGGPNISAMPVSNGTVLVIVNADVKVEGEGVLTSVYCSWSVRKSSEAFADDVAPDSTRSLVTVWDDSMGAVRTATSFAFLHQGLDEGTYDIRSQFRCDASSSSTNAVATIGPRSLFAIPL